MERVIHTPDGRTLAVQENGDLDGRPVLVHMGTPNSRHVYPPTAADAAARGLRLISYDRPGYGGSTPQPGRSVTDCAQDVRAICAELAVGRLASWGISGGGPYVLACAALLPDLLVAAASLASPAPPGAEGLDWLAGMGEDNADSFRLRRADPAAAKVQLEDDRQQALAASATDLAADWKTLLTPTDAAALSGDFAEYLAFSAHEGLAHGSQGWWDDDGAELDDWGFDLAAIAIPVLLLHGRQDKFVPFSHGEWLAAHIPGVQARLLDNDGHLTLIRNRIGEVHAWLAEQFDRDDQL